MSTRGQSAPVNVGISRKDENDWVKKMHGL